MKKTIIDIKEKQELKIVRTLIFKGDVSVIVTRPNGFMVVEMENNSKSTSIDLNDNEVFVVRNWG